VGPVLLAAVLFWGYGAGTQGAARRCSPPPARGPALSGVGRGTDGLGGALASRQRSPEQGAGSQRWVPGPTILV